MVRMSTVKPTVSDMHHYRPVKWEKRYSRDVLPQRILYSLGSVLTIFKFDSSEEALRILRSKSAVSPAPSLGGRPGTRGGGDCTG